MPFDDVSRPYPELDGVGVTRREIQAGTVGDSYVIQAAAEIEGLAHLARGEGGVHQRAVVSIPNILGGSLRRPPAQQARRRNRALPGDLVAVAAIVIATVVIATVVIAAVVVA